MFQLKVECKFKKNGCGQIVDLNNFLNHIQICQFSTEKLLPKLFKEDSIAGAHQQLNDDVNRIKQVTESLEGKHQEICKEFHEIKDQLRKGMTFQDITFKKLNEWIHNKYTTGPMQAEIIQLKIAIRKNEDEDKSLQEENNSIIEKIHKLADDKLLIKTTTGQLQSQTIQLTDALKKSEEATKELKAEHKKEIQKIVPQQRKHLDEFQTKFSSQFSNELTECQYLQEGDLIGSPPVVILWKVAAIQKNLRDFKSGKHFKLRSEEAFNVSEGLKFKPGLLIYSHIKWISIALEFSGDLKDKSNTSPYLHSRKYILLDQSNALEKKNIELIDRPDFGMQSSEEMMLSRFNYSQFFPKSLLAGKNRYIKNDQILIKIMLEPISFLYENVASSNGILLWRINNYSKKKRDEVDGVKYRLISQPFKTSETGYLLQVELYLNGFGTAKGRFLSIFSLVIIGANDSHLRCPFNYQCSYSLLDQSESHTIDNITMCANFIEVDHKKSDWGFPEFALQSQAEDQKYLKDNSLLIKVVAQILK